METRTIWPEGFDEFDEARRDEISGALHADPEQASELQYVRVHTGFCREITVTEADVDRLSG